MRSLLIVVLCCMTGCDSVLLVTGYTGSTVFIDCPYNEDQREEDKYFCEERSWFGCEDRIKTNLKNTWAHSERFSLYDNTSENYFRVVIKDLREDDEGTYRCAVDKFFMDSYAKLKLDVEDIHSQRSGTKTSYIGGKVTVECHLPENEAQSIRHFCKEDYESSCVGKVSGKYFTELVTNGRFTLYDNREDVYNLAIANLTDYDAGTYWCAVEKRTQAGGGYIALIQQVQLNIVKATTIIPSKRTTTTTSKPPPTSTSPTSSKTAPPLAGTSFSTAARPVPSTAHASSAVSTASSVTSPQTSLKRNTQVVTIVTVCLTVLVVTLILLILYRRNNTKAKGAHSSSAFQITSDAGNREDLDKDWHYEEIVARSLQPEPGFALSSIYVTATLPTDPSDSPQYSTVSFHKNSNCPNEAPTAFVNEGTPPCFYSTIKFRQSQTYPTASQPVASSKDPLYSTVNPN